MLDPCGHHLDGRKKEMNEKKMAVVDVLTEALAETSKRALEAERQRDEAKLKEMEWYQNYRSKDKEMQDVKGKLAAEIENHEMTHQALREALNRIKALKGEEVGGEL
jgi:hypothetical protein